MLDATETALLLQLRSRHRAFARDDERYAACLEADTAEFERRIELRQLLDAGRPTPPISQE